MIFEGWEIFYQKIRQEMNENLVFDTDEYLKFMKNHDFDEDNLHSFI